MEPSLDVVGVRGESVALSRGNQKVTMEPSLYVVGVHPVPVCPCPSCQ